MVARAGSIEDFIPDLRPYQDRDIRAIMDALRRLRRVMYTLPTGGGKTLIGFCVMANWLRESPAGVKAVWLTHGIELEDQANDDLARQPIDHSRNPTLVSSPLRLYNAMEAGRVSFGPRDLLVVDEAHHATARTWARVIQKWPGKALGLTATPWRLSANQGFDHLYDNLIAGPQKRFLIDNGWLTGAVVKQPRGSGLIKGMGSDGMGDYNVGKTMAGNGRVTMVEKGVDWMIRWSRIRGRRFRCVIYAMNISHAEAIVEYARSRGIRAELLTSRTRKDVRRRIIAEFREGRVEVVVNVALLTEGLDVRGADAVLLLRVTTSLALYLQMVGRAQRVADGKEVAYVFDATDNTERLGDPDADRVWSLDARSDSSGGGGSAPMRTCPVYECQTAQQTSARFCSSCEEPFGIDCPRCGWVFGYKHNGEFVLPEFDEVLGRCDLCSLGRQGLAFPDGPLGIRDFKRLFSKEKRGLRYSDRDMSVYYWVSAARDGAGQHSGGVYLRDPAVLSLLPDARLSRELGGSVRMRFRTGRRGFANVVRARTEHGVVKKLHDEAYKMIFEVVGERASKLLDANDLAE